MKVKISINKKISEAYGDQRLAVPVAGKIIFDPRGYEGGQLDG